MQADRFLAVAAQKDAALPFAKKTVAGVSTKPVALSPDFISFHGPESRTSRRIER
jgi:hypothetical protein